MTFKRLSDFDSNLPCLIVSLTFIACTLTQHSMAASSSEDFKQMQTLLKELRILKETEAKESAAWKTENGELDLLIQQQNDESNELLEQEKSLTAEIKISEAEITAIKSRSTSKETAIKAVDAELMQQKKILADLLKKYPLLSDAELQARLANKNKELEVSERVSRFWNLMLNAATKSVEPRLADQELSIDGKETRLVQVLYLGAANAIYLTKDQSSCGLANVENGVLQWTSIGSEFLPFVKNAFQVARNEIPAEIVSIPTPSASISKGGQP